MRISDWSSDVCSSDLLSGVEPRTLRARAAAASFTTMKHRIAPPLAALLLTSLAACSQPAPPVDNAPEVAGEPIATRAVVIGTEGPSLPACSSISRVKTGGTDGNWAPGQTRPVKAKPAGGAAVSLYGAAGSDPWVDRTGTRLN